MSSDLVSYFFADIPQSIVQYSTYIEKLSTLFMSVGRSAPRYQQLALLYPRSQSLQTSLCEYYIVAVRLCRQILTFAQKSGLKKFVTTFSDSETKSYQLELDWWANAIRDEMNLLMAKRLEEENHEISRFKALSSKHDNIKTLQRTMKTKLRVLDACSTYNHETTWKQARKAGNATLFNGNSKYKNWKCQTESCTLIYAGKLGSGKSVLLANIVDDLNLHAHNQNVTATYFFCRYDIPESLMARTIIGSLARQLLRNVSNVSMMVELPDPTAADIDTILRLLRLILPANRKAYVVLDGLDECETAERVTVLEFICAFQRSFTLLLCLSSRLEPDSTSKLRPGQITAPRFTVIPDVNPDIEAFIKSELEICISCGKLIIGDPAIILEIRDALIVGSQGIFLWVVLQIMSLCSMKSDYDIRQALADLPKDLSETYSRDLRRHQGSKKNYQRLILELTVVALRPLTTEEIREALSVIPGNTNWDQTKLINDINSTLSCGGGLVIVDEEELTVRLLHHSVKHYLLAEYKDLTGGIITLRDANEKMAEIVLTYLNYGVFETQLSTVVIPQIPTGSIPSTIIESTIGSPNIIRNLALLLLRSRKPPDHDIGKTIAETTRRSNAALPKEFPFLAYARLFWVQHTLPSGVCIFDVESPRYDLLRIIIGNRSVYTDMDYQDSLLLCIWAARTGNEAVVKLLLETGRIDANMKDHSDWTPLSLAAYNGHVAVVKLLSQTEKVDIELKSKGQTPLSWAAEMGHEAVVRQLLEIDRADIEAKDRYLKPLLFAAAYGREAVVQLLLEAGADVDSNDENGATPLSLSVRFGQKEVMELLLEAGAKVDLKNKNGETPLMEAASGGRKAIIKLLLETNKVNLESKNKDGETPLAVAVRYRHVAVVKLLLEAGANVNPKNEDKETPLTKAARYDRTAIMKLVQEAQNSSL